MVRSLLPLLVWMGSSLAASLVWAQDEPPADSSSLIRSAFKELPSRFDSPSMTVGSRSLGDLCHSRERMPDATVCNPAYLSSGLRESEFMVRGYIGNGFEAMTTAQNLIYEKLDRTDVQQLFEEDNVTSVDGNLEMVFTSPHFYASFAPYRLQYLSEIHNPNFPIIAIHAALERQLALGTAVSLGFLGRHLRPLNVGLRARIIDRKYVHTSFSLFEAVNRNPGDLVRAKEQTALYFDPSLAWNHRVGKLKYRAGLMLKNLGGVDEEDPLYDQKPALDGGVGLGYPIWVGELSLGLDWINQVGAESFNEKLRFGGSYQIGFTEFMAGINQNSRSFGIQFAFTPFKAGIAYSYEKTILEEQVFEQRVSTEFAVSF